MWCSCSAGPAAGRIDLRLRFTTMVTSGGSRWERAEKDSARESIKAEEEQENERLIYVALTRARAQLYLPFFPDGSLKRKVNGYYARLNDRLAEIIGDRTVAARLFEIEDVDDRESARSAADLPARLASWSPPPEALIGDDRDGPPERLFDDLRQRRAAMVMRSYTALERSAHRDFEPEDFKSRSRRRGRGGRSAGRPKRRAFFCTR